MERSRVHVHFQISLYKQHEQLLQVLLVKSSPDTMKHISAINSLFFFAVLVTIVNGNLIHIPKGKGVMLGRCDIYVGSQGVNITTSPFLRVEFPNTCYLQKLSCDESITDKSGGSPESGIMSTNEVQLTTESPKWTTAYYRLNGCFNAYNCRLISDMVPGGSVTVNGYLAVWFTYSCGYIHTGP